MGSSRALGLWALELWFSGFECRLSVWDIGVELLLGMWDLLRLPREVLETIKKKWLGVNYRKSLILILKYIDARNGELWALLERNREMAGATGCQALVSAETRRFLLVPSVPKSPQTRVEFCVCFISL